MTTESPDHGHGPHPVEHRIGDLEREQAARRVISAAGSGHLTVAEADERIAKVYQAHWPGDLRTLLGDLPSAGDAPQAPTATVQARNSGRGRTPLLPIILFAIGTAVLLGPWLHGLLWPALLLMIAGLLVLRTRANRRRSVE